MGVFEKVGSLMEKAEAVAGKETTDSIHKGLRMKLFGDDLTRSKAPLSGEGKMFGGLF